MPIARSTRPTAATRLAAAAIALVPGLAAAAAAPPAARAGDPHRSTARCRHHGAPTQRLDDVRRRGIAVRITCDGPAHAGAFVVLKWGTPQRRAWQDAPAHAHYVPPISLDRPVTLRRAGSAVTRIRLTREILRFLAPYRRTPLTVYSGVERDGTGVFSGTDAERATVLVR